jgi:hypothetical protein
VNAVNPIVAAYFRAADEARSTNVPADAPDVPESIVAVIDLLTEAGLMPERPRARLGAADVDPPAPRLTHLRQVMEHARDTDENAYVTRSRELAFLANTLLAGCSVQSRPLTPQEASDAAASVCNLGLEHWSAPGSVPIDYDLVTAFEVGWSVLHQDVSVFVARQLISTLDGLHCVDRDIQEGLAALRLALVQQVNAGTPWLAREAAEVLAELDMTAWTSVHGLLGQCPVLPAALTAILERRTTPVSPTAFDFISTAAQIGDVRFFMRTLPDVLRH